MRGKFPFTPRSAVRNFSPGCEGNPHGWLQAPESKFLEQTQDSRALECEKPGKTGFSVLACRYSPMDVPRVDLSIGAELLTSSELVFGTLNGDP